MIIKRMIKIYSPNVLNYINKFNCWRTAGEVAAMFDLNLEEATIVLNNLVDKSYIQKETDIHGSTVYGNFRLKNVTYSKLEYKSHLDDLFKRRYER